MVVWTWSCTTPLMFFSAPENTMLAWAFRMGRLMMCSASSSSLGSFTWEMLER